MTAARTTAKFAAIIALAVVIFLVVAFGSRFRSTHTIQGTVLTTNQATDLTAQQVLERMAQTYAQCNSYQDQGNVQTVFHQRFGKVVQDLPFTTAFIRADRFRYELQQPTSYGRTNYYIVHSDSNVTRTSWTAAGTMEQNESLNLALAGPTGISAGSAHTTPALLLPSEITGRRLTDMVNPKFLFDGDFAGRTCFRIQGAYANQIPTILWIDAESFLVRRIDKSNTFPNFTAETTTTYDIAAFNTVISDEDLDFNPRQ